MREMSLPPSTATRHADDQRLNGILKRLRFVFAFLKIKQLQKGQQQCRQGDQMIE